MKRTFSIGPEPGAISSAPSSSPASSSSPPSPPPPPGHGAGLALVAASTGLIAVTYGLVRLAYGLYLPEMQADLGFGAGVAGAVSSGGSLAYVVGAVTGFALAGRHSRGLVVAAGVTAGAGAAGMALAPAVAWFAVAAVLASTGAGLASPALVQVVRRGLEPARRAGAQTIVNAGTGPGLVAAGLLAFAVLPGWRLAWLVAAAASVVAAGAVLVFDRRASRGPSLVADGTGDARADAARPHGATDLASAGLRGVLPPRSWFVAHRWVLLAALLAGAASAGVWNYGRTLLVDAGVSAELSVWAWVCLGAGGTAVIVTARPLARLAPGTVWTLTLAVMAAGTAGVAALPGVVPVALVACAAFGWAYTAATGALIAWTGEIDAGRAASGTALLFVMLVLGQAAGAPLLGWIAAAHAYGPALTVAALGALVAALPALGRPRPQEAAETPARARGSR